MRMIIKRGISVLLLLLMLVSMTAVGTFAAEETEPEAAEIVWEEESEESAEAEDAEAQAAYGVSASYNDGATLANESSVLNTKHVAYISGYPGKDKDSGDAYNYFQPGGTLSRAAAAQMVYNLLQDKTAGSTKTSFTDVEESAWYAEAVNTLASRDIVTGKGDGIFDPNGKITRAEFVVILTRLFPEESHECSFTDVSEKTEDNSWYYNAVATASAKGWINGYEDNSFQPKKNITRAEAVKVLNRVLGRTPDQEAIDGLQFRLFTDVISTTSTWAYYEIMEAATDEDYAVPNTGLTSGYYNIGGADKNGNKWLVYVNKSGAYVYQDKGLQEMPDGKYYLFNSAGITFKKRGTGLYGLGGKVYMVDSAEGDGSFVHEPKEGSETRTYEFKNHLYYINEDGSILVDGYYGKLYFGTDGAYTSGDKTLDNKVYQFLNGNGILTSEDSQRSRLLAAYEAMRDYPQTKLGDGSKGYVTVEETGLDYDSDGYADSACYLLKNASGSNREWSAAMVYVARRLGYDTVSVKGTIKDGSKRSSHYWEVVRLDGEKYLLDVMQEWSGWYQVYSSQKQEWDFFMIPYKTGVTLNYGDRFGNTGEVFCSPYKSN